MGIRAVVVGAMQVGAMQVAARGVATAAPYDFAPMIPVGNSGHQPRLVPSPHARTHASFRA